MADQFSYSSCVSFNVSLHPEQTRMMNCAAKSPKLDLREGSSIHVPFQMIASFSMSSCELPFRKAAVSGAHFKMVESGLEYTERGNFGPLAATYDGVLQRPSQVLDPNLKCPTSEPPPRHFVFFVIGSPAMQALCSALEVAQHTWALARSEASRVKLMIES